MKKAATHPDLFLTKKKRLYYELIDQIIGSETSQLPLTEEAARLSQVNINTIKSVYSSLAQQDYIETRRKSGSRIIRTFTKEQLDAYRNAKRKVIMQLQSLNLAGFTADELVALLIASLSDYSVGDGRIIYTEKNFHELEIGKQELEHALGVPVTPRYIDDVIEQLQAGQFKADLLISTFFCEKKLRDAGISCPLIPLRITPPMEQLLNFSLIPRDTEITLAVISEHIRERINQTYPNIIKDFNNFRIYTLNEILRNSQLIQKTQILLTFKQTWRENEELFQHIPKIVTYNRFHDEEGLNQIRSLI
jgi:DNA-binding transcriptional regulator YhcF (GntR family)